MKKKLFFLLGCLLILMILINFQISNKNVESSLLKESQNIIEDSKELKNKYEENQALEKRMEEIENLEVQKEMLEEENKELKSILKANKKLEKELGITPIQGTVIQRDYDHWYDKLIINKGETDGIKKSMPVMSSQGLIGKISQVEKNSSVVELLSATNTNRHRVSGIAENDENLTGIIFKYNQDKNQLHFQVDIKKKVKVGQNIITSGYGNVYPKGIPIGKIENVENDKFGLTQTAYLQPFADFYDINNVIIIPN